MKFICSPIDPRKLSMEFYTLARQHPGRREFVHGRIHAQDCKCQTCRRAA